MATLVLSTVGTALGGPVGGAIGALIGQSIDQELLAPVRRGPRVGDLTVQTSSYGTQIPRIYGIMRVAGSVIWSTDLIEHENSDGAKGRPDVTYSYTVSLAVALSSRRVNSVKRIWAGGKLLRGAAGDFKVNTTFRFYDGSEDQVIDPLIGSIEGIGDTPGYRGLALAVFEDLELADFGNRIPFLTFEVEADDAPPTLGTILSDCSAGWISSTAGQTLVGFAAYGGSIRSAVEPLIECFDVELFDDGSVLRSPASGIAVAIAGDEFGNSTHGDVVARLHREKLQISSIPAALRLTFYDPARDYQTGETRAVAGEATGKETQRELAAVLNATDAKSLAQQMLARSWSRRDRLTSRLPSGRLSIEPGNVLDLPIIPQRWTVQKVTIDGFVVVTELLPSVTSGATVAADGGRIVGADDIVAGPIALALLDVPNVLGLSSVEPAVILAASTPTKGWKRHSVEISFGGQTIAAETGRTKAVFGNAVTILGAGSTELIDGQNSVEVVLIDADQWLTSCDEDALAAGANLAALGGELIQFGQATPLGEGRFRLSHLLRGRGGTEWACTGHAINDTFCVIQAGSLQPVPLPSYSLGSVVTASITAGATTSLAFSAEALRPPSPINLAAERQTNGDFTISWTRRSRQGFAWIDYVDAPLGETREQYRVLITGSLSSVELLSDQPSQTIAAATIANLGAGPATVEVRQIGDFAASRPAQLTITLP